MFMVSFPVEGSDGDFPRASSQTLGLVCPDLSAHSMPQDRYFVRLVHCLGQRVPHRGPGCGLTVFLGTFPLRGSGADFRMTDDSTTRALPPRITHPFDGVSIVLLMLGSLSGPTRPASGT